MSVKTLNDRDRWIKNYEKRFIRKFGSDEAQQGIDHKNRERFTGKSGGESRCKEVAGRLFP